MIKKPLNNIALNLITNNRVTNEVAINQKTVMADFDIMTVLYQ